MGRTKDQNKVQNAEVQNKAQNTEIKATSTKVISIPVCKLDKDGKLAHKEIKLTDDTILGKEDLVSKDMKQAQIFLENLKTSVTLASKEQALDDLMSKTEYSEKRFAELNSEIEKLAEVRSYFLHKVGDVPTLESITDTPDKMKAFFTVWLSNPVKGESHTNINGEKFFDIRFENMDKVSKAFIKYHNLYLDKPDSTEKTEQIKLCKEVANEFFNRYLKVSGSELYKNFKVDLSTNQVSEIAKACYEKRTLTKLGITKKDVDAYVIISQAGLIILEEVYGKCSKVKKIKVSESQYQTL